MCLYPKLIRNKKYTSNKKNGGVIPAVSDERLLLVPVGCQNCIECRKKKAREWQIRLLEEVRDKKNGKFVTLTFSNQSILALKKRIKGLTGYELDNQIATLATRLFLERWRKKFKISLRHWLVTEIGHNGTENIHMHGIVWTDEKMETVEKIWQYGYVWKGKREGEKIVNYVNEKTVNYIIKYVNKIDHKHKYYKSRILTSPGIGNAYTKRKDSLNNKYNGKETIETYKTKTGHKIALPIYWRNKIYTEEEREKLWLLKVDKQERWVCGETVDIKNGYEEYDKLVKYYRRKNSELGYGNDEKDEERMIYERDRRILLTKERISKAWKKEIEDQSETPQAGWAPGKSRVDW